jgi:hypothetical protein
MPFRNPPVETYPDVRTLECSDYAVAWTSRRSIATASLRE